MRRLIKELNVGFESLTFLLRHGNIVDLHKKLKVYICIAIGKVKYNF